MAGAGLRMADTVPIVVILGATGAGKSKLALELAAKFGGEIINADAMQMYRGLDIVTNKVTAKEQEQVRHHIINILDPLDTNNVVDFRNRALPIIERLLKEGKIPFICGGTNYYIESLLWKVLVDQELPLILQEARKRGHGQEQETLKGIERLDGIDFEAEENTAISTEELYRLLEELDPARAAVLHPRERRKVWRSLQVLKQHGRLHSALVREQGGALGGGLRFSKERICLIEVWSEQGVLDSRCDRRVDVMMERGLVQELLDFHEQFNRRREVDTATELPDYRRGIWQSIGFKEFHPFLILNPEERQGQEGGELFAKCVDWMKVATRQYARRQVKWMRRFLIAERDPPAYYRLDSSQPGRWREEVYLPAEAILEAVLEGRRPAAEPLPLVTKSVETLADERRTLHCDLCDRDFKGSTQFKNHMNSKTHRKVEAANKYDLLFRLEGFDAEARNESAKILKNTFHIGLTDVFSLMSSAPCALSVLKEGGESKARSIVKELAKYGIQLTYERKERQAE